MFRMATPMHWRSYSLRLLVVSALIWTAAHGTARFLGGL
jgi:hypothetical protein